MSEMVPPDDWLEAANLHATVAQLLSTVIHQVNNALQTIGGHAELLKTDPGVSETTKRRAGTITGVTDRTAAMLASFQIFTRPPAGIGRYDLREVATAALAFRHYGLGRARIQAQVDGLASAPVLAEARPLTQAVLNIILNAEQAMTGRPAEGRLSIVIGRAGDQSTLTVEDNGPGLESGAAAPAWTLGANNRLGLGWPAALRIVTRMGGRLERTMVPSGGTRVTLSMPAAEAAPES